MKRKQFALIFMLISLVFSQTVFAARFGGGKSRGMQRSQSTSSYNRSNNNSQQQYSNTQQNHSNNGNTGAAPRQGMGAGTAGLIGAAAGAAGGYMLGKSMSGNNNEANKQNASGVTQQEATSPATVQPESKMPWGIIGILAILLVLGLMFFRKKANPGFQQNHNNSNMGNNNNGFNIPNIQRNANANMNQNGNNMNNGNGNPLNLETNDRMPDGIESMYFLRQAKGMFLHIQSMNNPENVSEIAKYLTPELYLEVKEEMANNNSIADFTNLNCNLISSNMENNVLIASVSFNGLVSESSEQAPQPFSEIWNFIKPDINTNKWLVAGIQQVNNAKA